MKPTILVTGASGGTQGATGNRVTRLLREKGVPVRAFVRKVDERSVPLREMGAEIFVGDLLNIQSVREAMRGIEKVYFCYPVQAGLLEATAILAETAIEEGIQFVFHLSLGASSKQILLLNQNQDFVARLSQGHGLFQMMTGASPTPLSEWIRLNQVGSLSR